MQQMNMMGGGVASQKMPGQQQDFNKLFSTERGLFEIYLLINLLELYRKYRTCET